MLIRGGQFRPNIPAVDLRYLHTIHPKSTYNKPQNVLDAVQIMLQDYMALISLPKAKIIAKKRAKQILATIKIIRDNYSEIGF
jgi:hypothetical protein